MKETVKKIISDDDDDNDYDKREKKETRSDKHDKKPTLLHIYVTTSNLPNAGTNANVFLQLYKTKRIDATNNNKKQPLLIESFKFPLENLKSSSPPSTKKFQPGHTDLFEIEDDSFDAQHDQLERIRVSTDARPFVNAGWHLKRIVIRVPSNDNDKEEKEEYTFECGQWLDALEAKDKKTQRDLYPTERKSKTKTNSKDKETRDNFLLFNKVKENKKRSKDEFDDESRDSSFESDSRSDDRDRSSSRQSVDSHRRNSSKK